MKADEKVIKVRDKVLGYPVRGIAKNAFKGAEMKIVKLKSAKNTKKALIKNRFKKAGVKKIAVKPSQKKRAAKLFLKKNCGKAVSVVTS